MRLWLVIVLILLPALALAQSREVRPEELTLSVSVDERESTPLTGEMVLITIRGVYRRHITRETLRQPDLDGFSWSQLGPDSWTEERIDGKKVKILTRRMALYPDRAGMLTIGAFTHDLTLTDEGDDWFDHQIQSEPITVEVEAAPATEGWWFPVRRLQISDQWSNAPDQLKAGDGVLRVIRLEALGATPEMIPPMPELTSPSAMIFPHPEKRLVELTPEGPVTYAFWRWTIRPTNEVSAIVEPLTFDYYDTVHRQARSVTISPQRIAYGDLTPEFQASAAPVTPAALPGWPVGLVAALVFLSGLVFGTRGWRLEGLPALYRLPGFDPLARQLRYAARAGDGHSIRRTAAELLRRDGPNPAREALLGELDRSLFAPTASSPDMSGFARRFLSA